MMCLGVSVVCCANGLLQISVAYQHTCYLTVSLDQESGHALAGSPASESLTRLS